MPLWRLYYHLVWATKDRHPLITPELEADLYGYIIGKADYLECITHAIGGIEDHLHLVASIPPKLAVAEYVRRLKGSSAHHLNQDKRRPHFGWQRGYGVFSLGGKQLDQAVAYVQNQKAHHRQNSVIAPLERFQEEDEGPLKWGEAGY